LATAGIELTRWGELSDDEQVRLSRYFSDQVFPVLMPLAVDPAHPFPYISGLSLNLAVRVRSAKTGTEEFARLKIPQMLPRFVRVDEGTDISSVRFITLEDLISHRLEEVFPGMQVIEHHAFRVTRNEDVEIDEDETENLIQVLEKGLLRRRFGPPIRLEIDSTMDALTLDLLLRELGITDQEVVRLPEPLNLTGLFEIAALKREDLHFAPHVRVTSPRLVSPDGETISIFSAIRQGDVLLHHPYESFSTSVQAFLEQAAADPRVLAIKQTLYRTSGDSPIVQALIAAAESGKQVLALVEIKARFDEQANIGWARKLEKAGGPRCVRLHGR
jgi:polyphosphate kinase